ncbi:unnamed protein product [Pedinophyceae sp. YPF-701]|nr:unnamed protein product [Pedinophyceae sp. YPF-701]
MTATGGGKAPAPGGGQIDEDLHSRQLAVYGRESMTRMASASVLVIGLKGLGAEIAKNVILAGVKAVTLFDNGATELADLSGQFYLGESDVGKPRAQACMAKLAELNRAVQVEASTADEADLTKGEFLRQFQCVVATDMRADACVAADAACHAQGIPFIRADVHGVFARVFCDFGPEFVVADTDGEEPHTGIIASIEKGSPALVTCIDDERLQFQDGDLVTFTEVEGMTPLNDGVPRKVMNCKATSFQLDCDTTGFPEYTRGGMVAQVKQPKKLAFKPLKDALVAPGEIMMMDFSKFDRPPHLHVAYQALDAFVAREGRLPRPWDGADADAVVALAKEANAALTEAARVEEVDAKVAGLLAKTAAGQLNPMCATVGGIVGQEVVKAVSGKFHPVHQFLYLDAIEALPDEAEMTAEEAAPTGSRYDGQIAVLGKRLHAKVAALNVFTVGAGALGCEFLKNFALMGVGCGGGTVTVTDDDQIERSNLSRQFLFRDWDIGQPKSTCASRAAKAINPALNIRALQNRVSPDTEDVFNAEFWEGLDVVVNALDNVKARLYVDQRCVYFGKPLLESGTLGPKCNTQMVIPEMTENYGASRDPPEKEAPMCTVHSFPHNIDHCLTWARSEFEGMFDHSPSEARKFLADPKAFLADARATRDVSAKESLEKCVSVLVRDRPGSYEDCVAWARHRWQDYFHNRIAQLTHTFPEDAVTSTGAPFWSPPKRFPTALTFDASDAFNQLYVRGMANLKAGVHGVPLPDYALDAAEVARRAAAIPVTPFTPKEGVKIETDPNKKETPQAGVDDDKVVEDLCAQLEQALGSGAVSAASTVAPVTFEKDDDTNFHMDVIAALANLRARNYGIAEIERFKAKLIAGRIIPAIATATSLATGLVCLEFYKVARHVDKAGHARADVPIESFRNAFINLAIPLFTMSEPMPCARLEYKPAGLKWTLWSRWVLEGDLTVQEVLDWFAEKGVEAYSISCGTALLYNSLFPKHKERLGKKVSELVQTVAKVVVPEGQRHVDVVVACEDEEGEDVDVPLVSVRYR